MAEINPTTPVQNRIRDSAVAVLSPLRMNSATSDSSTIICPLCGNDLVPDVRIIHKHWINKVGHKTPREEFEAGTVFCTFEDCCFEFECSHSAYVHLTSHCRRRSRIVPKWLTTSAVLAPPQQVFDEAVPANMMVLQVQALSPFSMRPRFGKKNQIVFY